MSLNEPRKKLEIAGKGHNETLAIVIPVENTRIASKSVDSHASGNGGTSRNTCVASCSAAWQFLDKTEL
jgi:hypothetical protein